MNKMDVKKTCYLFFDFDGTVTVGSSAIGPDGKYQKYRFLPDENVRAIRAAHDLGHQIFLCTGRSYGAFADLRKKYAAAFDLPWDGIICGASDMRYHGKRLSVSYISKEECMAWLEYSISTKRMFCYNGENRSIRYPIEASMTSEAFDDLRREIATQLEVNPMTNMSVIPAATDGKMPKTELTVIHMPTYSDLFPPKCNKGSAIARYCELLGVSMEQTCCFGDSANDVDMFRVCNTRIAMQNAPEALRVYSDYVARGECGVAEGIAHLFGV